MIHPKRAAQLSLLAYESSEEVRDITREWGYVSTLLSSGSNQCFVHKSDTDTIVAFRGTEFLSLSFPDLLTNIRARQIESVIGGTMVHEGYRDAAWDLVPSVKPMLEGDVTFVGHSLGGCLALIAGVYLRPSSVYTFNATKCGDRNFANKYPIDVFRFVSKNDFFQSFPSDTKEWAHVGKKILLESKGHSMKSMVDVL